jgi:hypothetical protein
MMVRFDSDTLDSLSSLVGVISMAAYGELYVSLAVVSDGDGPIGNIQYNADVDAHVFTPEEVF